MLALDTTPTDSTRCSKPTTKCARRCQSGWRTTAVIRATPETTNFGTTTPGTCFLMERKVHANSATPIAPTHRNYEIV